MVEYIIEPYTNTSSIKNELDKIFNISEMLNETNGMFITNEEYPLSYIQRQQTNYDRLNHICFPKQMCRCRSCEKSISDHCTIKLDNTLYISNEHTIYCNTIVRENSIMGNTGQPTCKVVLAHSCKLCNKPEITELPCPNKLITYNTAIQSIMWKMDDYFDTIDLSVISFSTDTIFYNYTSITELVFDINTYKLELSRIYSVFHESTLYNGHIDEINKYMTSREYNYNHQLIIFLHHLNITELYNMYDTLYKMYVKLTKLINSNTHIYDTLIKIHIKNVSETDEKISDIKSEMKTMTDLMKIHVEKATKTDAQLLDVTSKMNTIVTLHNNQSKPQTKHSFKTHVNKISTDVR